MGRFTFTEVFSVPIWERMTAFQLSWEGKPTAVRDVTAISEDLQYSLIFREESPHHT
jgi:hypothetical protein